MVVESWDVMLDGSPSKPESPWSSRDPHPEIPFAIEGICRYVKERKLRQAVHHRGGGGGVKLPPELKDNRRAGSVGNLIGNAIATSATRKCGSACSDIQRGGTRRPTIASWLPLRCCRVDLIAEADLARWCVCVVNASRR